jgi:hypothetical protein
MPNDIRDIQRFIGQKIPHADKVPGIRGLAHARVLDHVPDAGRRLLGVRPALLDDHQVVIRDALALRVAGRNRENRGEEKGGQMGEAWGGH